MGCFPFKYEFWQHFRQDLYTICTKKCFCNAQFSEFGVYWGWSENFLTKPPKRHILAQFHAFSAIDRANPFTGFLLHACGRKKGHNKVTEKLYFTHSQGIPHPTKFNQNWHTSTGRRRDPSHQV